MELLYKNLKHLKIDVMVTKNRLKEILFELGFAEVSLTDEVLKEMGLSRKRFGMIRENSATKELTVPEKEGIENWLCRITGKTTEDLDLLGSNQKKDEDQLAKDLKLS
jgi:hypothetical protein